MRLSFHGIDAEFVPQDKLTPGEVDAVEKVTGLSFQRIRRMGDSCVCDHGGDAHRHKRDDGEVDVDDRSCTSCSCDEFSPDLPSRVSTAFLWVSLRRASLTLKFSDLNDAPVTELTMTDDDPVAADPTAPPQDAPA